VPWPVIPIVANGLFLVPIPFLLVWGFWTMLREPVTGWLPPTVLLAFCGGFVPVSPLLFEAGVRLNFAVHRPAYEAIVADARRDPLQPRGAAAERDGIVYAVSPRRPDVVQFRWSRSPDMEIMVVHDPVTCGAPARRGASWAFGPWKRWTFGSFPKISAASSTTPLPGAVLDR
jgi:hypothetical protein